MELQAGCTAIARSLSGPVLDQVASSRADAYRQRGNLRPAERRGTAHAVLAAREAIARGADDIVVVFADTPLIAPRQCTRLRGGAGRRRGGRGAGLSCRPTRPVTAG